MLLILPVRYCRALRLLVSNCIPKLSMKVISAALGHDVDNTTGRSTKLGIKATRLDLHFLHKLERQVVVVA